GLRPQDFACALALRSRPQSGSSSIPGSATSLPILLRCGRSFGLRPQDFACALALRSRPQSGSSSIPGSATSCSGMDINHSFNSGWLTSCRTLGIVRTEQPECELYVQALQQQE